ncbi:MAG: hypothetical protein R3Y04_05110 [Rikenellaceae bacterium]
MTRFFLLFSSAILLSVSAMAANESDSDSLTVAQKEVIEFNKFEGKLGSQMFVDFEQGFYSAKDTPKFNLNRATLYYSAKMGENFSGLFNFDFGATKKVDGVTERTSYVRNAEIKYEKDNLAVNFGMITLKEFSVQEKAWGHRFVAKSAMDEYSFGPSRDLGISVSYTFNEWLHADASMVNGEGYKKVVLDNKYKYALAFTVNPIKNLSWRVYGDFASKAEGEVYTDDQITLANFLGYKTDKVSIGAEYNYMWNSGYYTGASESVASFYGTYYFNNKFCAFARYDNYQNMSNSGLDTEVYYIGFQYQPIKFLRLSPTFSHSFQKSDYKTPIFGIYAEINI